jgi:hypothetical protein
MADALAQYLATAEITTTTTDENATVSARTLHADEVLTALRAKAASADVLLVLEIAGHTLSLSARGAEKKVLLDGHWVFALDAGEQEFLQRLGSLPPELSERKDVPEGVLNNLIILTEVCAAGSHVGNYALAGLQSNASEVRVASAEICRALLLPEGARYMAAGRGMGGFSGMITPSGALREKLAGALESVSVKPDK